MIYFKKQYEDYKLELVNSAANQQTNRTNRTNKTMKTMRTNRSFTGSMNSRFSNKGIASPKKKRSVFNYKSFLDENNFDPRIEELKKNIDSTNEYIGKTVFELASKTKETNEKLKKMVNK